MVKKTITDHITKATLLTGDIRAKFTTPKRQRMHAISSNPSMVGDSNVSIDIQCNIAQNRLGSNSAHSIFKTRQGPRDKNNNNNATYFVLFCAARC